MPQIALSVTLECQPEARSEVIQALLDHKARCLEKEKGTLQFEILIPSDSTSKLILFERYADANALIEHGQGASIAQFRAEVGSRILNATRHECVVSEA